MEAERRQVTILFTDMVAFTTFSERAGEEAAFTLMQSLARLTEDVVREHGGLIHGFTGDGVMAVFGAPIALEDGPLRACRAALEILERLKAAGGGLEAKHGVRPHLRIGINAGLAVVGQVQSDASAGVTVLGDTVNVAARLHSMAEPDAAVMSDAMHRLVEGLVEASFAGEHQFKGKAEPQKIYRLDSIRLGATRFEAAVVRGLGPYIGRERELDALEGRLAAARSQLQVVDVMAEPGMGKSRLLHEFRHRANEEQACILAGNCSPDGQQTPFLPFIDVVRGSFQVSAGEAEEEVAHKLDAGLAALGLDSPENLGLLLNLLGLKPREGALTGLDGVLIGLRTRDLLRLFLEARCRLSPVVLLIEDLHWIDSVSQEALGKIVGGETKLRLMVLHTRRPEYAPPWLDRPNVTRLHLEPLPTGDIRRLVQARLGFEDLPETLIRLVTEKAEGNALFAEEIVSFLSERGALRASRGTVELDADATADALPASVQSLLTARVDRLAPQDRALLQAAAVIGRHFDSRLLAAVVDDGSDVDARLAAMQALDLIHPDGKLARYAFRHALVRDAVFQSLLGGPRSALHLKIAEEVERRNDNRLAEVVEILAHHYSQTDRADKAFFYLAMAGARSLGVYSLDEADKYLAAAIALLDKTPDCASDQQAVELLVDHTHFSNLSMRLTSTIEAFERFGARLRRLGDNASYILVQHYYALALTWSARSREAEIARTDLSEMAHRLGDDRSKAYELATNVFISTLVAPYPVEIFEALSREAIAAASRIDDSYLQCFVRYGVGCEEIFRGRVAKAYEAADELMAVGRRLNDPRSTGLGMALQSATAMACGDYVVGLDFAEAGLGIARAPYDRVLAEIGMVNSLVALKRPEAPQMLGKFMDQCKAGGWRWYLAIEDGIWGVSLAMRGDIRGGIRWIEQSILRSEHEGFQSAADWHRLFLCEIYLEIISGRQKPSTTVLLRNILTLAAVTLTAQGRICALVERVRQNPRFDPNGHHIGRCEMILGLLYKVKKKRALAFQHLTEAKRIVSQFGSTPMLARIEADLAELA